MVKVIPATSVPNFGYTTVNIGSTSSSSALCFKGACIINDYELIKANLGSGVYIHKTTSTKPIDFFVAQPMYWKGDFAYEDGDPFYVVTTPDTLFAGKYIMYYSDENGNTSSIFSIYIPILSTIVYFKDGAVSDVHSAYVKAVGALTSDDYVGNGRIYYGTDESKADGLLNTFLARKTSGVVSGVTYFSVVLEFAQISNRLPIFNDDFLYGYDKKGEGPYCTYVKSSRIYDDPITGDKVSNFAELFDTPDVDMRFMKLFCPAADLYAFNDDVVNKDPASDPKTIDMFEYDLSNEKYFMGNDAGAKLYLNKINPCIYPIGSDAEKEELEIESGSEEHDEVWMHHRNEPAYIGRISKKSLEEIAEGPFENGSSDIGPGGKVAKVYILHIGDTAKWFVDYDGMHFFNKGGIPDSDLFYGTLGAAYDKDVYRDGKRYKIQRLVLPRIRHGKDVIMYDGILYISKKRLSSLNINETWAKAHSDTYTIGSDKNEFSSSNPAMSELVRIDVNVVHEDEDPFRSEYSYKKSEVDPNAPIPFIETIGRVLVYEGTYVSRKQRVLKNENDGSFIRLFAYNKKSSDSRKAGGPPVSFGMFLSAPANPSFPDIASVINNNVT